jgi:hypothetical protein
MIRPGDTPAGSQFVETPSGLLVPTDAADTVEREHKIPVPESALTDGTKPEPFNRDPDGRRRIVLTRDDRKTLNRAIRILQAVGLGIVVGCKGPCGQPLVTEGRPKDEEADPDAGYGCQCSRVHFR